MSSFEMQYDEDEDVLEVTFAAFDERLTRSLALNDHVIIFTDAGFAGVWGLTFYSYSRLLLVSETEFTALRDFDDHEIEACLALISAPPAGLFFDITDPGRLIARVRAPNLERLVAPPEGSEP